MMHMNGTMPMMMKEYFFFSSSLKNFLFKGLDVDKTPGMVGLCLIMCLLTILLESTKTMSVLFGSRLRQHPLTYGQTQQNHLQASSPIFRHLVIPSNIEQIKRRRIRYHLLGNLSHVFNVILGYIIMLAVMTFDAWIFIAVVAGTGIGQFLFGALCSTIQAREAFLQPVNNEITEDENTASTTVHSLS